MPDPAILGDSSLGETEIRVLRIWKDVLQIDTIGIDDGFLDLAGDSLAAVLCISRLHSEFGVEFALEDFFLDGATISDFARQIDRINTADD